MIPTAAGGPYPNDPPERADQIVRVRARKAAYLAQKAYPGPVGELITKELLAWEEFGFRLGSFALVARLVDHIHEQVAA